MDILIERDGDMGEFRNKAAKTVAEIYYWLEFRHAGRLLKSENGMKCLWGLSEPGRANYITKKKIRFVKSGRFQLQSHPGVLLYRQYLLSMIAMFL